MRRISYVVHDYYGCDSGCCGATIYLVDENDDVLDSKFEWLHYDGLNPTEQENEMRLDAHHEFPGSEFDYARCDKNWEYC